LPGGTFGRGDLAGGDFCPGGLSSRGLLSGGSFCLLDGTPSLAASQNKMLMRAAIVVQVLQDLFYVLLHVLFYM